VVQGAYLLMNCVTFVARFLFFHHVLFAKKEASPVAAAPAPEQEQVPEQPDWAAAETSRGGDTGPMALVSGDSGPPRG
jgi:hypothetical protein